jgi:hypothetical protein
MRKCIQGDMPKIMKGIIQGDTLLRGAVKVFNNSTRMELISL